MNRRRENLKGGRMGPVDLCEEQCGELTLGGEANATQRDLEH